MDKKKQTNKKKASDLKSGVFSFSTRISKDVVTILERNLSEKHKIRALALLHEFDLAFIKYVEKSTKEESEFMPFGTSRISDYLQKYEKLLKVLLDNGILIEGEKGFGQRATSYKIGSRFIVETENKLEIPKKYKKLFDVHQIKSTKRAKSCTTDLEVTCDIDYDTFFEEMMEYGKSVEEVIEQWEVITNLNNRKKLTGKMYKKMSRIYGNFHTLSKPVNTRMKIDGKITVSIDQHCTYFTLLPSILRSAFSWKNNEKLNEEIQLMYDFICESENIYQEISKESGLTVKETKQALISWICEPNNPNYGNLIKIDAWMEEIFPICREHISEMRTYSSNCVSTKCVTIESLIFNSASRHLNQCGIPAITKHDQLNCFPEYVDQALMVLEENFRKYFVPMKVKIEKQASLVISSRSCSKFNPFKLVPLKKTGRFDKFIVNNWELYNRSLLPVFVWGTRFSETQKTDEPTKIPRKRVTQMKDGRWTVKFKKTKVNSRKDESVVEFVDRLIAERPEEKEMLLKEIKSERSDAVGQKNTLTLEIKDVTLIEPVEAVLDEDIEKMTNDAETSQKPLEQPINDQYEEMSDFERHIIKRKIA